MTRKLSFAAVGAASLLFAACGSTESGTITLTLQHQDCLDTDALQSAQAIEVTVAGPGMEDVTAKAAVDKGTLDIPEIPAGADREVTVRATNGAAENPLTLAIGRSEKFTVKATQSLSVSVPMVALNRLHPTANASNQCTQSVARAGQSVATLSDGRVLLVGGFTFSDDPNATVRQVYLDTVELYDPVAGTFTVLDPLPRVCGPNHDGSCARAFAPAVVQPLANGERILIVGGEYRDEAGAPLARGEILSFNPSDLTWSTPIAMQIARRFHSATLLPSGEVLIVGGFGNPGEDGHVPVVGPIEFLGRTRWDSTTGSDRVAARALHAVTVRNGAALVAGGVDETYATPTPVLEIGLLGGRDVQLSRPASLERGVIGSAAAVFWKRLVVVGGVEPDRSFDVTDPGLELPAQNLNLGTPGGVQLIPLDGSPSRLRAAELPVLRDRVFGCAAPIDDSRVLVAGGVTATGAVEVLDASAEVLAWVDLSQCVPGAGQEEACTGDFSCDSPSRCVDGTCLLSCTQDSDCKKPGAPVRGSCQAGVCRSDLANPAHRCTVQADDCFPGSACVEDGRPDVSYIGFSSSNSKLLNARAWSACNRISDDQILITGGVSQNLTDTLGDAEVYEIMHAGR